MNKKVIYLFIFIIAGLILAGGIFFYGKNKNNQTSVVSDNKIIVTTSFYPIYFLTSQLGGDLIDAVNLTPSGTEPHDYELTAQDIIRIKKSQLLILNGGGLEIWEKDLKSNNDLAIITLGDGLVNKNLEDEGGLKKDPHIWLSPILAIKMAEKITEELVKVDFKNRDYYQSNLDILKTKLINLDIKYEQSLVKCQRREIITSHNAFGYLTDTYDLEQISIAGLSPEEEPSIKQLTEIAQLARDKNIKYIFFESLTSPKLSQTIAGEIGAQTLVLNPIEGLSDDELSQGKNYLTEMEKNLENLKIALECK